MVFNVTDQLMSHVDDNPLRLPLLILSSFCFLLRLTRCERFAYLEEYLNEDEVRKVVMAI